MSLLPSLIGHAAHRWRCRYNTQSWILHTYLHICLYYLVLSVMPHIDDNVGTILSHRPCMLPTYMSLLPSLIGHATHRWQCRYNTQSSTVHTTYLPTYMSLLPNPIVFSEIQFVVLLISLSVWPYVTKVRHFGHIFNVFCKNFQGFMNSVYQNVEWSSAIFCYWANSHCWKWPNIEQTFWHLDILILRRFQQKTFAFNGDWTWVTPMKRPLNRHHW